MEQFENPSLSKTSIEAVAQELLMAGKYDEVVALWQHYERAPNVEFAELLSWAYLMQGNALSDPANLKTGPVADKLFDLAAEKYQAALAVKPDSHEALNNWGNALLNQARTKTGVEADKLFDLAAEKYRAALAVKPDSHEALVNWGNALLEQAKSKTSVAFAALLDSAKQKLLQAEAIKLGAGSYNLACISALERKEEEAQKWLIQCQQQSRLPSPEHIEQDHDLDSLRGTDWFIRFLETLKV